MSLINRLFRQTAKNIPRPFGPVKSWSPGAAIADLPSVIGGILVQGPTRSVLPQRLGLFRQAQPVQFPRPYKARVHLEEGEEGDKASHVYFPRRTLVPRDLSIQGQGLFIGGDPHKVAIDAGSLAMSEKRRRLKRPPPPVSMQRLQDRPVLGIIDQIVGRFLALRGRIGL